MLALYRAGRQTEALEVYRLRPAARSSRGGPSPGRSCGVCTRDPGSGPCAGSAHARSSRGRPAGRGPSARPPPDGHPRRHRRLRPGRRARRALGRPGVAPDDRRELRDAPRSVGSGEGHGVLADRRGRRPADPERAGHGDQGAGGDGDEDDRPAARRCGRAATAGRPRLERAWADPAQGSDRGVLLVQTAQLRPGLGARSPRRAAARVSRNTSSASRPSQR